MSLDIVDPKHPPVEIWNVSTLSRGLALGGRDDTLEVLDETDNPED